MKRIAVVLLVFLTAVPSYAWNATGHKALLRDDNSEDIAEDVYNSIQVLGYDELNGRAGRHGWGMLNLEEPRQKY